MTFCWRRARVRSFSLGLHALWRVRARASACLPLMCVVPRCRRSVKPPFLKPPLMLRHDAAAGVVDPAHRVDEGGEVVEVDLEDVVDRDAEVLLDRLHRERGAADRVGRVDLVAPVAGDVDDGVARDRELGAVAAAGAHEQDRVAAAGARGARAGLLGPRRALVGAEDEGRLRLEDPDPAVGELGLRGGGHLVLVDLRGDEEEDEREADPGDQRERQPLDHAADADRLALALLRRRAAQLVEHRSVVAAAPWKARTRAVDLVLGGRLGVRHEPGMVADHGRRLRHRRRPGRDEAARRDGRLEARGASPRLPSGPHGRRRRAHRPARRGGPGGGRGRARAGPRGRARDPVPGRPGDGRRARLQPPAAARRRGARRAGRAPRPAGRGRQRRQRGAARRVAAGRGARGAQRDHADARDRHRRRACSSMGASCTAARGAAAELGHIIVDADGPPCPGNCPNHGCLEALVSGHAIGARGAAARALGAQQRARARAGLGARDHRRARHGAGPRRRPGGQRRHDG